MNVILGKFPLAQDSFTLVLRFEPTPLFLLLVLSYLELPIVDSVLSVSADLIGTLGYLGRYVGI